MRAASSEGSSARGAPQHETKPAERSRGRKPTGSSWGSVWQFHPQAMRPARSVATNGGRFWLDGGGLRFWSDSSDVLPRASENRAEVPLSTVSPSAGGWTFISDRGDQYFAKTPLGTLRLLRRASEPVFFAQRWGRGFIGVGQSGRLLTGASLGEAWAATGAGAGRFAALLARPYGPAVALSVPEGVWRSAGPGQHWERVESDPVGAFKLVEDAVEGPVVVSALGSYRPSERGLEPLGRPAIPKRTAPSLPRGPSAAALERGEAVLMADGRYVEVVTAPRPGLYVGPLGGSLEWSDQPALQPCLETRLGAYKSWLWVACTREGTGVTRDFQLFAGTAGGKLRATALRARGHLDALQLAAGAQGRLVVSGLCPPARQAVQCKPQGLRLAWPEAPSRTGHLSAHWRPLNAPTLRGSAQFVAFSPDGTQLFAGGWSRKAHPLIVLRSADDLRLQPIARAGQRLGRYARRLQPLGFGTDGTLSLLLQSEAGSRQLLQLGAHGPLGQPRELPAGTSSVGGAGAFALAVSDGSFLETLDGGRSWETASSPSALDCEAERSTCANRVWCSAAGCVVGESFSRRGWGRPPAATDPFSPDPPEPAGEGPARPHEPLNFSCTATDAGWQTLDGVRGLPDAASAALGDRDWFLLGFDDDRASVGLWTATGGRPPQRDYLLSPHATPASVAYRPSLQVEGAAAIRYRIPEVSSSAPLQDVELSWRDLLRNRSYSVRLDRAGPLRPADFRPTSGRAQRALADLLSISSAGLYVRVHAASRRAQPTYFLRNSRERPLELATPRFPDKGRSDMITLMGRHYALLTIRGGSTVLRQGPLGDPAMALRAATIGVPSPRQFGLRQSVRMAATGLGGLSVERLGQATRESAFFPFAESGSRVFDPPLAAAETPDTDTLPSPCPRDTRDRLTRTVARLAPWVPSSVTVWDSIDGQRELTGHSTVLFGRPDSRCLATLEARLSAAGRGLRALVDVRPEAHSWLFRAPAPRGQENGFVSVRRLSCARS